MKFKVWDALNGDEKESTEHRVVEADSPADAATLYAEEDRDGYTDGLYHESPQPIHVRCPDGTLRKYQVSAELVPNFRAAEES